MDSYKQQLPDKIFDVFFVLFISVDYLKVINTNCL